MVLKAYLVDSVCKKGSRLLTFVFLKLAFSLLNGFKVFLRCFPYFISNIDSKILKGQLKGGLVGLDK